MARISGDDPSCFRKDGYHGGELTGENRCQRSNPVSLEPALPDDLFRCHVSRKVLKYRLAWGLSNSTQQLS